MIEQISVGGVASYTGAPALLAGLKAVNFIFGANGSGKTTISRVVAKPEEHPTCSVAWAAGAPLQTLVYNRDFVEQNFVSRMPGIFTLGHEDANILSQIEDLRRKIDDATTDIRNRKHVLEGPDGNGGEKKRLADLELDLQEKCWTAKVRHEDRFKEAFRGVLNSRAKFAALMFNEFQNSASTLRPIEELVARAETVFAEVKSREDRLPSIGGNDIVLLEAAPILDKRVMGKEDVPLAGMIKHLRNSDWVRQGLGFFHENDDRCPFCQQSTDAGFRRHLEDYFDQSYQADVDDIATLVASYAAHAESVGRQLDSLAAAATPYADKTALHQVSETIRVKCALNVKNVERKRAEPSSRVELEGVGEAIGEANALIEQANERIDAHNSLIDNIVAERETLVSDIWRFIVDEASITLNAYREARPLSPVQSTGSRMASRRKALQGKSSALPYRLSNDR